ncbi:MAG: tetratricopeptide repeat protein, partial [Myxococcota bacterium]
SHRRASSSGNTSGNAAATVVSTDTQTTAVTLLMRSCNAHHPYGAGCRRLGHLMLSKAHPPNPTQAAALFIRACDAGDADGCLQVAEMHAAGKGVPHNPKHALERVAQACLLSEKPDLDRCTRTCHAGQAEACTALANLFLDSSAPSTHPHKGVALLRRSCHYGSTAACLRMAYAYQAGQHSLAPNPVEAASFFAQACTLGDATGCAYAINLYSTQSNGVPQNLARVASLLQRDCHHHLNTAACTSLGDAYRHGHGVPQNATKARSAYHQACHGGPSAHKEACVQLGRLHQQGLGGPQDPNQAILAYSRACGTWAPHPEACIRLGLLHEQGWGVPQNMAQATAFYNRVCSEPHHEGCLALAQHRCLDAGLCDDLSRRAAQRAAQHNPTSSPEAFRRLGDVLCATQQSEWAIRVFAESCQEGHASDCNRTCVLP